MTLCTADFELGTNGNDVLVADAGSATAWDARNVGGGSWKYDNAHVYGSMAGKVVTAGTGVETTMEWTTALGSPTEHYERLYIWLDSLPTSSDLRLMLSTGYRLDIKLGGEIRVTDNGGFFGDTTAVVTTGQKVRLEWHVIHSATVGQHELKLFNSADSITPTETLGSAANRNTGVNCASVKYGDFGGSSSLATVWLDNIVAGATSYPGPAGLVPGRTFKRLYGPALLTASAADLYTAPTGRRTTIRNIHASNPSGSPVDLTLSIGTDAAATRLWDGYPVPADDVLEHRRDHTLKAGEKIQGFAGSAGVLNLTIDGYEESV